MKKVLLFVVLATSMSALAQNLPSTAGMHPTPYLQENFRTRIEEEGRKLPGIYPHDKFEKNSHYQTPEQQTTVQLNDSLYTWRWNTVLGWTIYSKIINMVYDGNNNLTFYTSQTWNGSIWVNNSQYIATYDSNNNKTSSLSKKWDGNGWRIVSEYRFTYDSNNNKTSETGYNPLFYGVDSTTWSYDANNNETSEIYTFFNGSAWENVRKTISTYDANDNQTYSLYQTGYDSVWVNSDQDTYTYDANNNQTSSFYQQWSGNEWVNYYQGISTYDANNNKTSNSDQYWVGNTWVNSSQSISTYDTNNNETSHLYQKWGGNAWVNDYLLTYTYDANNNETSYLYQIWIVSHEWMNISQSISTYDANNNLTSYLLQKWAGSVWVNSDLDTYTYDANNHQTSETNQYWKGGHWVNEFKSTHAYDGNNSLQNETNKYFDSMGNVIPYMVYSGYKEYSDSTHYYSQTIIATNDLKVDYGIVNLYPNPNSGKFTISSNRVFSSIEIYNLLGERVYSDFKFNQQTTTDIDLSDQGKGIYFINIYDGKLMYIRKFAVQ